MAKQQAKPEPQEDPDPLEAALAADPWERTEDQRTLIIKADADVRLQSMVDDQEKLKRHPSDG